MSISSNINPAKPEETLGAFDDAQKDFPPLHKPRKMKILLYALHRPLGSGYIGGVWVRLLEFLKRAKTFDLQYVLLEPYPKFKDKYGLDYENITVHSMEYTRILDDIFVILEAIAKGVRRARKRDIDLIISPIETPYCIISAFATSMITGIPWTLIAHDVPVYAGLMEGSVEKHNPSLKDLYVSLRHHKHKSKGIHYITFSAILNYITYKILRTTLIIAIGSTLRYLNTLDYRIHAREVFPANTIPSSAIAAVLGKRLEEPKEYDALFVGSLIPEKGIFDVISAWSILTKKNPLLNLCIIGKAKDPRILELIETLIEKYKLSNNVHILSDPFQGSSAKTVYETMKKSKILIFPSRADTWSIVVGEALALGLPVVAYDIYALKRAYADCKAIVHVPIGNVDHLATEALKLFENPPQLSMLSKEASRYMDNYFTWNQIVLAERTVYEELLKTCPRHYRAKPD